MNQLAAVSGAVLTRDTLRRRLLDGSVVVTPILDDKQIGEGSINISLGTQFITNLRPQIDSIDPDDLSEKKIRTFQKMTVVPFDKKFILHPGSFLPGPNQFCELLRKRMVALGYTRKDISIKIKRSVEHVRKLLKGEAFPGSDLQEKFAEVLQIDYKTISEAVKQDRWLKKYGTLPSSSIAVERVSPMGRLWDQLTGEQREDLLCMAQCLIRKNRRKTPSEFDS